MSVKFNRKNELTFIYVSEEQKYFLYFAPQQVPFLFQLAMGHSAHGV